MTPPITRSRVLVNSHWAAWPKAMDRQYDIFEILPNGSPLKIAVVSGLKLALLAVRELATHTSNECLAEDTETHQIVAQWNVPRAN